MSSEQPVSGIQDAPAVPMLIIDANAGDLGDRLLVSASDGIARDGSVITRNGVKVGTVDAIDNGEDGAALKIVLDAGADREAIDAVFNSLRFETIADDPASGTVTATLMIVGLEIDGPREFDVPVPVVVFEDPYGEDVVDDILAEGLGGGQVDDGIAHAGKFLFVSEDFLESMETGTYNTVIHGFTLGDDGDVLDLGAVLRGGTYGGGSLDGYIELDDSSGTYTVLRVDIQGAGNYIDLAIIEGTTGLGDADGLLDSGNIVV